MRKSERHDAIRRRASEAIRDLYHNATPRYPRLEEPACNQFEAWFSDAASWEIEYLQDGGAYGKNYRKTLQADCNAGRFKSSAARDYYVRKGMRAMLEDRACNAMWEWIGEFGKLYTYGRGGRTLAPDNLYNDRNWGGGPKEDYCDGKPIGDVVRLIQIVESFNRYVAQWCQGVPEMWNEYWQEEFGGADVETVAELGAE